MIKKDFNNIFVLKYQFRIEVFYDNDWHFVQYFEDLGRAKFWFKLYKDNFNSSRFRLIQVLEVI